MHVTSAGGFNKVRDRLLAIADPGEADACVDLGAGTGFVALELAPLVDSILAVDISPVMAQSLAERAARAGLENVRTVVADLRTLQLPSGCADLIVSSYALHHLRDEDKRALAAEAARWLRPGGRIVVADMMFGRGVTRRDREILRDKVTALASKGPAGWWRIAKNIARYGLRVGHEHPASPQFWQYALRDAGFTDVRFEPVVAEAGIVCGTWRGLEAAIMLITRTDNRGIHCGEEVLSLAGHNLAVVPREQVSEPGRRPSQRSTRTAPEPPRPRPAPSARRAIVDVYAAVAGLGFGAVLAAVILDESRGSLAAPGGLLTAAGRLAGFTGAYLMLIMVVLVARLPWLERSAGQDQLVRWHRRVAPWGIGLITAHVVLIVLGYAQASSTGPWHELWVLLTSYRDILAATVGFGLIIIAGVSSYRHVRRRLRYETWWVTHLYLYLALALAFAHQIFTGIAFIGHPLVRAAWIVLWSATAGMVLVYRVAQPVWRSLRHRLRIVEVRPEAKGVVSVVCQGRHLDRLAVSGGQFFIWHFLIRGLWWQGHPYSLSALPQPPYIRVTIKGLGDQSRAVARLRPGTWVAIEGPYGAFTKHAGVRDGVALFAAGVGITPIRALLEDLPAGADVVVVVRASTPADLVHRDEVAAMVRQRGGRLHEIVGARHKNRLNTRVVRSIVPDIAHRDVYICGPDGFSAEIADAAQELGTGPEQIHTETFGF